MEVTPDTLSLVVAGVQPLTEHVKAFRLRLSDGAALPGFSAGAHVKVEVTVDGARQWRHYSLINLVPDPAATEAPEEYLIAVRREEPGRGGSRFMHEALKEGDRLTVSTPINNFPLDLTRDGHVLVAGGIGVTPILSMAAELRAHGKSFTLHYTGRSRAMLCFLAEMAPVVGEDLRVYADDEPDCCFVVDTLLSQATPDQPIYVCGPKGMIDAVIDGAVARGWDRKDLKSELFTEAAPVAGDHAFEVELAQSGRVVQVPADRSILDVLIDEGLDPLFDCKRGECGVCSCQVIDGEIDHRDYYLDDAEKASGTVMQVCVSRAKGKRLVLDM